MNDEGDPAVRRSEPARGGDGGRSLRATTGLSVPVPVRGGAEGVGSGRQLR